MHYYISQQIFKEFGLQMISFLANQYKSPAVSSTLALMLPEEDKTASDLSSAFCEEPK